MSDDSRIVDVLEQILDEIRGLRSDFMEFTSYNVHNIESVVTDLTGPLGYNLGDLNDRLSEITVAIASI